MNYESYGALDEPTQFNRLVACIAYIDTTTTIDRRHKTVPLMNPGYNTIRHRSTLPTYQQRKVVLTNLDGLNTVWKCHVTTSCAWSIKA